MLKIKKPRVGLFYYFFFLPPVAGFLGGAGFLAGAGFGAGFLGFGVAI